MKTQRDSSGRVGALSSALLVLFLSSNVVAIYPRRSVSENDCIPAYINDGDCDYLNNIDICGYDGGDCCECTCTSNDDHTCGDHGGFACIDPNAECVDDDDVTTNPESYTDNSEPEEEDTEPNEEDSFHCISDYFSDGDCDLTNNNEHCDYDGGDCCECTCIDTKNFPCGHPEDGGYSCLDPSAECVDDDDVTTNPKAESFSETEFKTISSCDGDLIADGNCDPDYNNEECGYDGGDCCECTCTSTGDVECGDSDYDCIDPSYPCIDDYVLSDTKTTISVSANAYDSRPGYTGDDVGCGEDGCLPALTRDGVTVEDGESRWSCAQDIVPDGGLCEIEFVFQDPQDIMDVQVAFYKGDDRSRTLEVAINGENIGEFDSYPGSTFNELGIDGVGVSTLSLISVGLSPDDWISILEVRFLVEP